MNLSRIIKRNLLNIPGWRTNRKIVVIESDDWGSIRMASKKAYNRLLKKGYPVDKHPFNKFDSLESDEDIEILLEVLSKFKDINGNPPIFTLNNVVANPDFKRIKENDFTHYFYEPFTETLKKYPNHDRVYKLLNEGIENKLIKPQYHGREHLNISRWMYELKMKNKPLLDAFENEMYSLHYEESPIYFNEYLDALDIDNTEQLIKHKQILCEGNKLFNNIWGIQSKSFIANCYVWHPEHEKYLNELGITYIQGIANQFIPTIENSFRYKRVFHYQGQKNNLGQRYLVRNAFFEPYQDPHKDHINECINRISLAFKWRKPAIISTHRINYIGFIYKENRDKNINLLQKLLSEITQKWPNIEFVSSDKLGDMISKY